MHFWQDGSGREINDCIQRVGRSPLLSEISDRIRSGTWQNGTVPVDILWPWPGLYLGTKLKECCSAITTVELQRVSMFTAYMRHI